MKQKKLLMLIAVVLVVVLCVSVLTACKKKDDAGQKDYSIDLADVYEEGTYGEDFITLYEKFGKNVTIDQVTERNGLAYATFDGKEYELGMDFLSMAMVYNTSVPEGSEVYKSTDDVYAQWWKLYIQRWNYLLPEVPLYSNEYYDLYDATVVTKDSVEKNPTNPYWGAAQAVIDWKAADSNTQKKIILGSSTELSGRFRVAAFGVSNPGASDNSVSSLVNGLDTVAPDKLGNYVWNSSVIDSHNEVLNADGSKTFTIKIKNNLKFSDGSAVTAKNYLYYAMVFSTVVAGEKEAGGKNSAGLNFVGYDAFSKYTGTEAEGTSKYFEGLALIDEYTFSVTIDKAYIPYYYDTVYASFTPSHKNLWLGESCDIAYEEGKGCYITGDAFYAKDGETYTFAKTIGTNAFVNSNSIPWSGPYYIDNYDEAEKQATLKRNTYFVGNYEGSVPDFETIVFKKVVSKTQMADFKQGGVNVLEGITGGDATKEAIKEAYESNGKFAYIHYARAGYGKLGFRCDFGPTQFASVRRAIAYSIDRSEFAQQFTGGYGGVVDGPYYTGAWMYLAVKDSIQLDKYTTSVDSAIEELEDGGWIYDIDGNAYTSGVRYKKLAKEELTENNLKFASKDGKYKTVKVNGEYYMPLVINWFGTTENDFTDQLLNGWASTDIIGQMGMVVQYQFGDFTPMLGEFYQYAGYGYQGPALYGAFNFATGYNSAVYDYSYNWTFDPNFYDDYSSAYLKDAADYYYL